MEIPGGGNPEAVPELREMLRSRLPAELAPHLLEARVRNGELVLFAESAAWAGRLKLAATELIASAQRPAAVPAAARVVTKLMPRDGYRR